jgi:uncharacterized NAD-dependent epimerase/dehydratase family protein
MTIEVGIWIDHKKAVIATITDGAETMRQVTSTLESHSRFSARAERDGAENQRDRRFDHHLDQYYDEVVERVRDAESILIVGPGEAKGELRERLTRQGLQARIVGVEAADKMTDRQIAALVRERFAEEPA